MKLLKILLLLILFNLSCTFPLLGPIPMRHWEHMPFFPGGAVMWIVYIILIGLIVYLIVNTQRKAKEESETALDMLKKRYAKGEITKDQFKKMKKDIED
jgi:putative membrane protein